EISFGMAGFACCQAYKSWPSEKKIKSLLELYRVFWLNAFHHTLSKPVLKRSNSRTSEILARCQNISSVFLPAYEWLNAFHHTLSKPVLKRSNSRTSEILARCQNISSVFLPAYEWLNAFHHTLSFWGM